MSDFDSKSLLYAVTLKGGVDIGIYNDRVH